MDRVEEGKEKIPLTSLVSSGGRGPPYLSAGTFPGGKKGRLRQEEDAKDHAARGYPPAFQEGR